MTIKSFMKIVYTALFRVCKNFYKHYFNIITNIISSLLFLKKRSPLLQNLLLFLSALLTIHAQAHT